MSIQKQLVRLTSAAVAVSALALATPANAVYVQQPYDPSFTPVADDLIAAGSDTTEIAVHNATEGFNTTGAAFKAASYQAGGGGTIPLPDGTEITRPNGSGNGKNLLHGATNNPNIDFARSSDALDEAKLEKSHGLQLIPFALDTLQMGVSNEVVSNAPATLSIAQILSIYKGECTTWTCVGGTSTDTIKPSALQQGSGTAKFFKKQLEAANGGAFTYGSNVDVTWQEHSDVNVKGDPNAIAPFSVGRAALLGTTVKMVDGWSKNRALYNVVRGTSGAAGIGLGDAKLAALLGSDGYLCSPAATEQIRLGGFKQLLPPAQGGVCGVATQDAPTNVATEATATTTTLAATTGATAGTAVLEASVAPSAAAGEVEFFDGTTSLGVVPTTSGVAKLTASGLTAGAHDFKAVFTHDFGTAYFDSEGAASATVKAASTTTTTVSKSSASYGFSRTVTATVKNADDTAAAGSVKFYLGATLVATKTLSSGVATYTVPATKAVGSYTAKAVYVGTADVATSNGSIGFTVTKAGSSITESFPDATQAGYAGKGTVTVKIPYSTVKPTGTIRIYKGATLLKSVTLSSTTGAVTVTLPKLTKGKHLLTIKYLGSTNVNASSKGFYITQR